MSIQSIETGLGHFANAIESGLKAMLHFLAANPQALKTAESLADVGLVATGSPENVLLANAAGSALQTIANVSDQQSPTIASAVQVLQAAQQIASASGNADTAKHIDNVVNALTQNAPVVATTATTAIQPTASITSPVTAAGTAS
jgi:hypothetical protein